MTESSKIVLTIFLQKNFKQIFSGYLAVNDLFN